MASTAAAGYSKAAYDKPAFFGYSAWLMPAEEQQKVLDGAIKAHATAAPPFTGHLTVLAGVKDPMDVLVERLSSLAARHNAFEVDLSAVEVGEKLMELNADAQKLFGLSYTYKPHLSLVYGHLSAEEKEKHAAELREQLVGKLKVQFQAIELWDTNGEVQDWKLVQRFPLKQ